MESLKTLLDASPVLCSSDSDLLLREAYDTAYGIYNHDLTAEDRPLALIAFHGAEDTMTQSLLYERVRHFKEKQIGKYFNMSFDKFIELPTDLCLYMMDQATQWMKKDVKAAADVFNDLGGNHPDKL